MFTVIIPDSKRSESVYCVRRVSQYQQTYETAVNNVRR